MITRPLKIYPTNRVSKFHNGIDRNHNGLINLNKIKSNVNKIINLNIKLFG